MKKTDDKHTCENCKYCFIEDLYHDFACSHPKHRKWYVRDDDSCVDFEEGV